jgi:hypothetical protein
LPETSNPKHKPARLLWDKGGLWSLMTWQSFSQAGLDLAPVSAREIADGGLKNTRLLVVPGGWAALKYKALGQKGCTAIKSFVKNGGLYLGFCGGAGLALTVEKGLGLIRANRTSGKKRLPSLSGPIYCLPAPGAESRPLWQGLETPSAFSVWWPGQFALPLEKGITPLVQYLKPAPGFCTSDLVADQIPSDMWPSLEKKYGMRLDPSRMRGLLGAVSAEYGQGEVLLSYLHWDTPFDPNGKAVLKNLWHTWLDQTPGPGGDPLPPQEPCRLTLYNRMQKLWDLGEDLGLWQKRHPVMPLWKRGARGLEFFTLLRLVQAACLLAEKSDPLLDELARRMEPVLQKGPSVLKVQAEILAGQPTLKSEKIQHDQWFPRPRRVGSFFLKATEALEQGVGVLIKKNMASNSLQAIDSHP